MRRKKHSVRSMDRGFLKIAVVAAAVVVVVVLLVILISKGGKKAKAEETEAGVNYIKQLEAADTTEIEQKFKTTKSQRIAEQFANIENGEASIWTMFDDYVILGDSRAVGYWYFGFLPQERCITEGGATIRDHLTAHIPDIEALAPSNIFLLYGLNDVSIGYWDTPEDYVAEYKQILSDIQSRVPGAKIYVSSILPARDPAFAESEKWHEIPTWSEATRGMCEEMEGVYYVDNDGIAEEYADLWDEDGIHVMKEFYEYWAANLIVEQYMTR